MIDPLSLPHAEYMQRLDTALAQCTTFQQSGSVLLRAKTTYRVGSVKVPTVEAAEISKCIKRHEQRISAAQVSA